MIADHIHQLTLKQEKLALDFRSLPAHRYEQPSEHLDFGLQSKFLLLELDNHRVGRPRRLHVRLLANPPREPILGLAPQDDHPELDGILTSMLMAANDLGHEFGEELRRPEDVTPAMRAFFQTRVTHHVGADQLNGRPFQAQAGIGIPGPAAWALHGWSLTS